MTKQVINVGTTANDKKGDSLRAAFQKVNANFTELYNRAENTDSQTLTLVGDTLSISGGNSVDLSKYTGVGFSGSYNDLTDTPVIPTDVSDLTDTTGLLGGGAANTGDITFDGVKVIGAGTASGDGAGYSTLELVPDNNLYANHQYLVVDPTAPSHIHIRAGGTQDASNAELFLGGEKKYIRVSDSGGVRIQDERTNTNYYYFASPDIYGGNWYYDDNVSLSYVIVASDNNASLSVRASEFLNDPQNILNFYDGVTTHLLTSAGSLENLGGGTYRIGVNEAPPPESGGSLNLVSIEFVINSLATNYLEVQNNDFRVQVSDDVRITSGDVLSLRNNSPTEPVTIIADYDNTEKTWAFNPNGSLTFPDASVQTTAWDPNNTDWAGIIGPAIQANGLPVGTKFTQPAPLTSKGADGDTAGTVAFDGSYIYYCTATWTDGVADIWRRVAWSNDTW